MNRLEKTTTRANLMLKFVKMYDYIGTKHFNVFQRCLCDVMNDIDHTYREKFEGYGNQVDNIRNNLTSSQFNKNDLFTSVEYLIRSDEGFKIFSELLEGL